MSGLIFSERLRAQMSAKKITQLIMSEAVGVTQGAVSGWLNGAMPKMDKLLKIAEVLGVEPIELINIDGLRGSIEAADKIASQAGGSSDHQHATFNKILVGGARAMLKAARKAKGFSQAEFAKKVGYKDLGTYQAIEEGRSQMGEKMAIKAAKILGIDVSVLMDGSDHPVERDSAKGTFGAVPDMQLPPGMKAKYVPLLAMAQCGPLMAWDDGGYTGEGFLAFNPADPRAFAVTLSGDSMIPRIEPGDVALIYPSKPPKNGSVVIARLNEDNGGDVMLKLYQSNGDRITLSSYNPAYPPMQYSRADFAWIYPVAKITKDL